MLLVGANDGRLYALDALSGKLLWKYRHTLLQSYQLVSSVLHSDGRVYFGSFLHGAIFAMSATRQTHGELWIVKTGPGSVGAGVPGSIALGGGLLFVGANDMLVHALSPNDGRSAWTFQ